MDAVTALERPLLDLEASVERLELTVSDVREVGWVFHAVSDRLDGLSDDLARQRERSGNLLRIVEAAPEMLGSEGARVYFIAFLTPAVARGSAGFMENWAELTIDDGAMSITGFGSHADLDTAAHHPITVDPEWLDRYGDGGQTGAGTSAEDVWSNITASPDWPTTASVIADLYPQSGGVEIDGVVGVDVFTIAKFLDYTGPVDAPGLPEPITSSNAAEFLLRGQYLIADREDGRDLLADVAFSVVNRLFSSALPRPQELTQAFGTFAKQGRLLGWAKREEEQAIFRQAGMSGALAELLGADAFTFSLVNAGEERIDDFLEGSASYDVTTDASTGAVEAVATVTLRNTVPAAAVGEDAEGNPVDLPPGTNRTWVSTFSVLTPTSITVDGEPVELVVHPEAGLRATGVVVEVPAQGEVRVEVRYAGTLELSSGYRLVTRTPATARPMPVSVVVDGEPIDGDPEHWIDVLDTAPR